MMGGSIQVDSKAGVGSTFVLRLPMRAALDQHKVILTTAREMSDPKRRLPVYKKQPENPNIPSSTPKDKKDSAVAGVLAPTAIQSPKKEGNKLQLPKFTLPAGKGVVLVMDDNHLNRKIIGKMLSFYGIEYEMAVNGQEAIDIVRKSHAATGDPNALDFGLIFMDLQMPVCDGFEAIETIRNDGIRVPIVALTANALSREK